MLNLFGDCNNHFIVRSLYLNDHLKYGFLKHKSINYNSPKEKDRGKITELKYLQDRASKYRTQIRITNITLEVNQKKIKSLGLRKNTTTNSNQSYGIYDDNAVELENEFNDFECLLY